MKKTLSFFLFIWIMQYSSAQIAGYTTPQGWKADKYADGDLLTPLDLPKNEYLQIWVQLPMTFSGTLEEALQKSYDETAETLHATKMYDVNGGNYSKETIKKSFRGWEYIRCSGGIKLGTGDYPPEYGLDLFVIKLNNRFERISVLKSRNHCNLSLYYPSDRSNYYYAIENFLFSLQFPDWTDASVKTGTALGDDIIGAWEGISMTVGAPTTGAGLGAGWRTRHLIFLSNGQAFFGTNFPNTGFCNMNTYVLAELNRRDWGTYTFANGTGVLKLPYGNIPLRMEKDKLVITTSNTNHGFVKTTPVDGGSFSGKYALSNADILGNVSGEVPVITFTEDGRFMDKGAMKILFHEYVDCLNSAKEPGSGTYEIKNYSVIFNYTDGRKIQIAFLGENYDRNHPGPATLILSSNEDICRRIGDK